MRGEFVEQADHSGRGTRHPRPLSVQQALDRGNREPGMSVEEIMQHRHPGAYRERITRGGAPPGPGSGHGSSRPKG